MLLWMCLTPFSGYIADRIGTTRYLKATFAISFLISLPAYYAASIYSSISSYLYLQILLSVVGAGIFGPVPGLMKQFFETSVRYSGVSLSNTLAQATLGGLSPFYSVLLISITAIDYSPAFLLIFASLIGYYGINKTGVREQ